MEMCSARVLPLKKLLNFRPCKSPCAGANIDGQARLSTEMWCGRMNKSSKLQSMLFQAILAIARHQEAYVVHELIENARL